MTTIRSSIAKGAVVQESADNMHLLTTRVLGNVDLGWTSEHFKKFIFKRLKCLAALNRPENNYNVKIKPK